MIWQNIAISDQFRFLVEFVLVPWWGKSIANSHRMKHKNFKRHSVTFLRTHRSLLLATRRPGTGRDCPCRHTAPCRPRGKTPEDDKISDSDNDQDDDHLDLEHPGLEAPSLSPHSRAAGPSQLALGAISFPVTAANLQRENVGYFHNFSCIFIYFPLHTLPPVSSQPTAHSDIFSMNCRAWRAL